VFGVQGRVALLGHPVAHSVSPAMQNTAMAALHLAWRYEALDVEAPAFEHEVRRLMACGYVGANVTLPYKQAALRLADAPDECALAVGAANTLAFREGGIFAYNTDVAGLRIAWDDAFGDGSLAGARVCILGAGGGARAAVLTAALAGAARVVVLARLPERAAALVSGMKARSHSIAALDVRADTLTDKRFAWHLERSDAVIQATSVGMAGGAPGTPATWPEAPLPRGLRVFDLIYRPRPTRFLQEAAACGAATCDGLGMLAAQGAASLELWCGKPAPRALMRRAAEQALEAEPKTLEA